MSRQAYREAPFVTVDVFTKHIYTGNQLAVIRLEQDDLTYEQKIAIAREYNFSEVVFLYETVGQEPRVDILTPENEMQFAGHPVIGTGHVLFKQYLSSVAHSQGITASRINLWTKAGMVELTYDPEDDRVAAQVPHNVHIHSNQISMAKLWETQKSVRVATDLQQAPASSPVLSIVKGVTYVLADLTSTPLSFAALCAGPAPEPELDADWQSEFVGTMYYRVVAKEEDNSGRTVTRIRVRMITQNLEDPACGSGSCALAAFLALYDGRPSHRFRFNIDEGAEIQRPSHITVDVETDETGKKVSHVTLAGSAVLVTRGQIYLPDPV